MELGCALNVAEKPLEGGYSYFVVVRIEASFPRTKGVQVWEKI